VNVLRLYEQLPVAAAGGSGGSGGGGGVLGGGRGGGGLASWTIIDDAVALIGNDRQKVEVAGWRPGRRTTDAPDWICVPGEEDRAAQLERLNGRVAFLWLLDQTIRQILVYRWRRDAWEMLTSAGTRLRAEPFPDVELDLSSLWAS
jgi:hypothetical protein